ncbi:MAG: hypothetical protein FWH54_05865 [Methanobrevibacter sp.]|nr:hypothetical protein [Methanobrevibacter sp.]
MEEKKDKIVSARLDYATNHKLENTGHNAKEIIEMYLAIKDDDERSLLADIDLLKEEIKDLESHIKFKKLEIEEKCKQLGIKSEDLIYKDIRKEIILKYTVNQDKYKNFDYFLNSEYGKKLISDKAKKHDLNLKKIISILKKS